MADRFEWNGFSYESKAELEEAKREEESIRYIRAKMDLTNPANLKKVYLGLVAKNSFVTPAGTAFMLELRRNLLATGQISKEELPGIPISLPRKKGKNVMQFEAESENKNKDLAALSREKLKTARFINILLVLVVVAMFLITVLGSNSPFIDAEIKVQNKYSAWEQELTERENALEEWEDALEELENSLK